MRAQCPSLRQSCASLNAYDASEALYSVLLASPNHIPRTKPTSPVASSRFRRWLHHGQCSPRLLSTTTPATQESQKPPLSEKVDVYEESAEKINVQSEPPPQPLRITRTYSEPGGTIIGPTTDAEDKHEAYRRPYSWQAHIQKIAENAGRFSKMKVRLSDTETIYERRKLLYYGGSYIEPQESPLDQHLPIPWAPDIVRSSRGSGTGLEEEINRFVEYIEPTTIEKIAREAVISELLALIAKSTSSITRSEIFGSERTGLAVATSDIDIRLECNVENEHARHKYTVNQMKRIEARMQKSQDYILVVSRYYSYPIINAQHKETGIHIQIVASPDTSPQEQVTVQYLAELPHLRSLYLLLRTALGTRSLVDVFSGGTGSYGLFIMLVASIKRRRSNPPVTLTDQLFQFINFYSQLDLEKYGVSVSPPKLFKKHNPWDVPIKDFIEAARRRGDTFRAAQWAISQRRLYQPYLLCLQDPARPNNDLGRKSNAIKHVIATLNAIGVMLKADMREAGKAAAQGRWWSGESILLRFVGQCHEVNLDRRRKLEEYGLRVMSSRKRATEAAWAAKTPTFAKAEVA